MRRIFVRLISAAAALGLMASPALAGKTPTEINTEIDTLLADNRQGLITEAVIRAVLKDIAAAQASLYYLVSTCTANQWVSGFALTGAPNCTRPSFSSLSGSISPGQMIAAGAGALGGVYSSSAQSNQFATGIDTTGSITYAQPAFSNLSGSIAASQLIPPTLTTLGAVKAFTGTTSQWPWQLNTDGTWTLKHPDAADVTFTQSGTGAVTRDLDARAKDAVSVKDFGAKGDGATDDTTAIQNATNYATSVGKVVYFPGSASAYIACHITTVSNMGWVGDGPSRSVIKLKSGCNTSLMDNGTSHQIDDVLFYNLGFDGNRANNSDGDMIVTYGAHPTIVNVNIWNVAGHALQTFWDTAYASRTTGFEGFFQNIHIDTVNKSCWVNNGPNDSHGAKIIMTDCSLGADNGYYGLYMAGYGNGRWSDIHHSNRDSTSVLPAAGVYVGTTGNTFSNTHFEGGYAPLVIAGSANSFDGQFYAPRGPYAVQINAGYNVLKGAICTNYASSNPNYLGINLASAGNIIDVTSSNCNNGVVNFASDGGNNIVRVRGYQASGTAVANYGSRAATTTVDMEVIGGATSGSHHDLGNFSYSFAGAPIFTSLTGILYGNGSSAVSAIAPGTGVAAALAVAVNASGGFSKVNGSITAGNAVKWSASGIQDAGIAAPTINPDGAWTSYTPSLTYPDTAPTTAAVSGFWKQLGSKTYVVHIDYNVTTLGPGAGNIYFGLPNSATLARNAVCSAVNYDAGTVQSSVGATAVGGIILIPSPAMAAQQYYVNCTFEAN